MPPEAEVSYPAATQQGANTMAETVSNDRPATASRPRSRRRASVSASALALYLDCSRAYVGKLEAEGVINRQRDGFPLDQSRVAYLRYLRRERKRSPRLEADAAHIAAKTELLQLRLMEKRRELVLRADADALIDQIAGTVLTALGGIAVRCSRDMAVRRNIDAVVDQVRRDIAAACLARADVCGEPPLDQRG
jgi:hypothetical protein